MHVTFPSNDLTLEGELTLPPGATRAGVICHPHPQYGGDMDNLVVRAVEAGLQAAGYATLRFNFRGAGRSTGSYDGGGGEQADARAAAAYLRQRSGAASTTLSGFSFGAMVTVQAGHGLATVDRLIVVAPPLVFFDLTSLTDCTKAKLFLVGDSDQYCSVSELTRQLAGVSAPKTHRILTGADHFLHGFESAITAAVSSFAAG